jgi:hypothetical protein
MTQTEKLHKTLAALVRCVRDDADLETFLSHKNCFEEALQTVYPYDLDDRSDPESHPSWLWDKARNALVAYYMFKDSGFEMEPKENYLRQALELIDPHHLIRQTYRPQAVITPDVLIE